MLFAAEIVQVVQAPTWWERLLDPAVILALSTAIIALWNAFRTKKVENKIDANTVITESVERKADQTIEISKQTAKAVNGHVNQVVKEEVEAALRKSNPPK